jgi:hypothetical protein
VGPSTTPRLRRFVGTVRAAVSGVAHFDRESYAVDVMENVFRGVQVLSDSTQAFSADIVNLDFRAWVAATAISSVHVRVLDPDDR